MCIFKVEKNIIYVGHFILKNITLQFLTNHALKFFFSKVHYFDILMDLY